MIVGHRIAPRALAFLLALVTTAVLMTVCVTSAAARGGHHQKPKILYVWAGDAARAAPDFLAVISLDEDSRLYGKVLRTVPLPAPGDVGNEPHHMHLSVDKNVLVCGGLLSLLRGQDSIFFFDVSTPLHPRLVKSASAPMSGITDHFYPLAGGGFLVSQMGSAAGGSPGRVAEFDANLDLVAEWPSDPPLDGFNPHGLSARPELNLMVTADFIDPASTLNVVPGEIQFRGAVRVWDFEARTIVRTVQIPTAIGTMDVKLIPEDPQGRAYTFGMFDGLLYLIDTAAGTSKVVFDTVTLVGGADRPTIAMPQIMAMNDRGDRLFVSLYAQGKVAMLDIADAEQPKLLSLVDLGPGSGPHNLMLTEDGKRLIVTDYFLNEDDFGKVKLDGNRKVHVLKVHRNKMKIDPRFSLDFNTAFATGPARPHGIEVR
jgi:selenium-binding protein 1